MIELAEVLRRHWPAYEAKHQAGLLPSHRAAVRAILACRTPALGGRAFACGDCGGTHFAFHSCNHRACPRCGQSDAADWIQRQKARLLPVPYFMITFTVPEGLRAVIRSNQKIGYNLLFSESSGALEDVAANPRQLGAELGFMGVLHTWTRQLEYHPHIHYVVPGAGLTSDGLRWKRSKRDDYFLSGSVLALRFKNRLRRVLEEEHQELLRQIPAKVWRQKWVVDVKAVGTGEAALNYLSAYVYRTALGNDRIVRDEEGNITFLYRDSADGKTKSMTVTAHEFIRRFLQHVLPRGFARVRHFGWLSAAAVKRWRRIGTLLDRSAVAASPSRVVAPAPLCKACRKPMRLVGRLERCAPSRGP